MHIEMLARPNKSCSDYKNDKWSHLSKIKKWEVLKFFVVAAAFIVSENEKLELRQRP